MWPVPRQLPEFQRIVDARGASLRTLPFEELESKADAPTEVLEVDGRHAVIHTIVEPVTEDSVRIVLQGHMPSRFFLRMSWVALDGFYKSRDGAVTAMRDEEFYEYD